MNRILLFRPFILLAIAGFMLGGCSLFHRDTFYEQARETRPLEVPPDLDTPIGSEELAVPPVGGTAGATAPTSAPPAASIDAGALRVADSVDHAYERVGIALERAQVGTISARDASAHRYTVEVAGLTASAPAAPRVKKHWYSRVLHPFGGGDKPAAADNAPVSGTLTVTVSADGDAARVEVTGPEEAARRVLAILRQRLS